MGHDALGRDEAVAHSYLLHCRLAIQEFKVCPLCSSVNVVENEECFACRWSGAFEFEPATVESRLYEMISHCPELLEVLLDEGPKQKPSLVVKMMSWLTRRLRPLDQRA